jgi:hypothetical protein
MPELPLLPIVGHSRYCLTDILIKKVTLPEIFHIKQLDMIFWRLARFLLNQLVVC